MFQGTKAWTCSKNPVPVLITAEVDTLPSSRFWASTKSGLHESTSRTMSTYNTWNIIGSKVASHKLFHVWVSYCEETFIKEEEEETSKPHVHVGEERSWRKRSSPKSRRAQTRPWITARASCLVYTCARLELPPKQGSCWWLPGHSTAIRSKIWGRSDAHPVCLRISNPFRPLKPKQHIDPRRSSTPGSFKMLKMSSCCQKGVPQGFSKRKWTPASESSLMVFAISCMERRCSSRSCSNSSLV